ncbi:hypothetical protein HMPREF9108_00691 [Leptotrichia sp. oral taxon 225 str. F0581]|nr:hypothetical protein HMPREF9108_00691 [Leptotrichia sp. oral taxon 225 str. F0581]
MPDKDKNKWEYIKIWIYLLTVQLSADRKFKDKTLIFKFLY